MLNPIGNAVHYAEIALIIRLKTQLPAQLHRGIVKGILTAQKLALQAEDLSQDERDGLIALNEMMTLMLPSETHFEKAYTMKQESSATLS